MDEMLVTFYCAKPDAEAVIGVLRAASRAPVHVRNEQVFGHDFGDARTAEQVRGSMDRAAITLTVPAHGVDALVAAVAAARRAMPVRWHAVALHARGRVE